MQHSVPRREKLITPMGLLILSGFITIGLVVVFPDKKAFMETNLEHYPDSVSLAYLRLAQESHPEDHSIRIIVSRQLKTLGRLKESLENLEPVLSDSEYDKTEARFLVTEIHWLQMNAKIKEDPRRLEELDKITKELEWLAEQRISTEEMYKVRDLSLQSGRPDIALKVSERMVVLDSKNEVHWLAETARWHLANNDPKRASHYYFLASQRSQDPEQSRIYALKTLESLLAADEGLEALAMANTLLQKFPNDVEILELSKTIAQSQSDLSKAANWGRRLVRLKPEDMKTLAGQFELELAVPDLDAALEISLTMVSLNPEDPSLRHQLAKVAEWAGRPRLALSEWLWLSRKFPREKFLNQALHLSLGLYEYHISAEVMELKAKSRILKEDELTELVVAYERIGEVDKANLILEEIVAQYPDNRHALQMMIELQERQGKLADTASLLREMSKIFGTRLEEVVKLGEVLWSMDKPEEALEHLLKHQSMISPNAEIYWSLLAELTWSLEANDHALKAYRVLWKNQKQNTETANRLLLLTQEKGLYRESMQISEEAWQRFNESGYLLTAMEMAMKLGDTEKTAALMSVAYNSEELFVKSEFYLLVRGQMLAQRGEFEQSLAYYHKTLELNPNSRYARPGLLWLLIDNKKLDMLSFYLKEWYPSATFDTSLWPPYAAGFQLLSNMPESIKWYARQAHSNSKDHM